MWDFNRKIFNQGPIQIKKKDFESLNLDKRKIKEEKQSSCEEKRLAQGEERKFLEHKIEKRAGNNDRELSVEEEMLAQGEKNACEGQKLNKEREKEHSDIPTITRMTEQEPNKINKSGRKTSSLPDDVRQIIISLKENDPEIGTKNISNYLKEHYFIVLPRKRINKVLKAEGLLTKKDDSSKGNSKKGDRRFEAQEPNSLWQMDLTNVYIQKVPLLYLAVIIDDHSRYCLHCELTEDKSSDTMIEQVHKSVKKYGKPEKLLTDQGCR